MTTERLPPHRTLELSCKTCGTTAERLLPIERNLLTHTCVGCGKRVDVRLIGDSYNLTYLMDNERYSRPKVDTTEFNKKWNEYVSINSLTIPDGESIKKMIYG